MAEESFEEIQVQLQDRRKKLEESINTSQNNLHLVNLLKEVDDALERIATGTYGLCDTCHEPIEHDRLLIDPLITFCLAHLSKSQQKSLERDLELAAQIQRSMLPKNDINLKGFEVNYYYSPAGLVSGDYCDIVMREKPEKEMLFIVGDVTGKGIAASMLMTHMHAMFHSLIDLNLPLEEIMVRANRLFCESSPYTHFVTMVCGKINEGGEVQLSNAGHCLPVLIRKDRIENINSTGLPLGVFCTGEYNVEKFVINPGESIFIYTDGLSEASNGKDEFGTEKINQIAGRNFNSSNESLFNTFLDEIKLFTKEEPQNDDLTFLSLHRFE
jgi:sigma-B regulation protein RsbU (phosphoserine phosphatase)